MKHHTNLLGRFAVILVLLVQMATASGIGLAQTPITPSGSGDLPGGTGGTAQNAVAPAPIQAGTLPLGFQYVRTFGVTGQPYPSTGQNAYLNHPAGITFDAAGNLYTVENNGNRLWGFKPATTPGSPLSWAPYGIAGVGGKQGWDSVMNNSWDVYAGPGGKLWVTNWNWITLFDPATGTVLDNVDTFDPNGLPYQNGNRFDCIQGLEMDQSASPMRLFVAETCNYNEVLVLDVVNPYDSATRTFTLTSIIQGKFWNPWQIKLVDLDGNGKKLYVAYDGGLLAFSETSPDTWEQTASYSGNGLRGLALNPADSNHIYAAGQAWNGAGVLRCDVSLSCDYYIQGQRGKLSPPQPDVLWDPFGLVFDSGGGVYVTEQNQMTIEYFSDPNGAPVTFYGTPFKPYDTPLVPGTDGKYYYNNPVGVASDSHHNVYILEQNGARLTKLGPDGGFLWSFGTPGVGGGNGGSDSSSKLNWPQGSPAVDALGRVYIPDRNNNRVVILDSDGTFLGFIGQQNSPNYQFDCPNGVSIGPNGDIFVVDNCANNVQIYNSERYFRSSIGVKWSDGSDDSHFSQPSAITMVDQDTVLVADRNNARIQKCTRSYGAAASTLAPNTFDETWACSTFAGATFDRQNDNYHFDWLNGLAWDGVNKRLYTSEDWHNAFKVFDENGKLITVVGDENNNGADNYHFSTVTGLAVDPSGNVYAVDQANYRVQKYIPVLSPLEFAGQMGGTMDYVGGDGTHLYASLGARLASFGLTDPQQPALLGTSDLLPGTLTTNPVLTSGAVFTLLSDNTLRAFSVADPAHPTQVGMLPIISPVGLGGLDGWLFTVSCCGGGQGWNGPRLYAIDAHDPANPVVKAWITLDLFNKYKDWNVEKIEVGPGPGGTYGIYLAAHEVGVLRVSFDPANPPDKALFNVQQFYDGNLFTSLALSADGNVVYALDHPNGDGNGHLHILDAGAMKPKDGVTNQYDVSETDGIFRSGSALYLYNYSNLSIHNLVGTLVSTYNANQPDIYFRRIYVADNRVYDAADIAGLLTFDIVPFDDPPLSLAARFKTPAGAPGYLEGIGSTIYDSTSEGGLRVIDASNPSAMSETFDGITNSVVNRTALAVIGGQTYAFMLGVVGKDTDMLAVANVAAPGAILANSQGIGIGDTFGGTNALLVRPGAAKHARVYVPGANSCIYVYDVNFSNLANVTISLVNKSATLFKGYVNGAAFYGNYLLASASGDGVHIFNNLAGNPSEIGIIDKTDPNSIVVVGDTAYFTDLKYGLILVDLKDIANKNWPEIGKYWFPDWPGYLRVKAFGSKVYAYIPNGNSGLRILDVSDPGNIIPVTLSGPAGTYDIAAYVNGSFVYESSIYAGLYAYWAPPYTQAYLANDTDLLDSSAVDGVTYHLNATPPETLALLHMPVYTPNAPPLPSGAQATGHTFDVFARSSATDQPVTTLGSGQSYTLTVSYTPAELGGLAETTLRLYYWDGSSWVIEPSSVVDTAAHTVTATPNHFSLWSLFGWLDNTPPTGTLAFNPSTPYTTTTQVNMALTWSPDTWQVRLCEVPGLWGAWTAPTSGFSFNLSSGDGLKTVEAQLKDFGNNVATLSAQITLDSTPPTGSINFGGISLTDQTPLNLTISASDTGSGMDKMRFSEKADFGDAPAWLDYAASAAFAPSAGDGVKTVYAQFKDLAGNVTGTPISAAITLDQTPPTGSLYINSGASVTTVPAVMLTLAASDNLSGPAKMRFSTSSDFTGILWQAYAPTQPFTLTGPDGSKDVYAQVQDAAGNISTATIMATILLDSTPPAGSVAIDLKPFTTNPVVNLTLAAVDAVNMRVSNSSSFPGADATWGLFATSKPAWTLSAGDGPKTVYAQFQDNHGNTSAVFSDSTMLDTTPPVGQLYINGGASVTTVPGVMLTLAASDNLSGPAKMRFSTSSDFTGILWQAYTPSQPFTLTGADGSKDVYAQVQDAAGNISTATIKATILLDSTLPTGSVTIDLKPFTTNPAVNLTLAAVGAVNMRVSNSSSFPGADATWGLFATSKPAWTLSAGDGPKTVYAQFQDSHGNTSAVFSDSTVLDTTPPAGQLYINGGASVTTVPGVMLTLAASDSLSGPAKMRFSTSSDFTGILWQAYTPSQPFTLTGPDGSKDMYAQVQDAAGNISTATIKATIVLDSTPPAGSVTIDLKPFTTNPAVNLTLAAVGAANMRVSNSSSFPGTDGTWGLFTTSKAWTLSTGDGPKTVYVQFQDSHGNTSAVFSDSTMLDTTPPVGQLFMNGGAAVTAVPAVKLFNTFTETGSGVSQYRVADSSGGLATATWHAFVNPADYTLPAGDGLKTVWIQLKDAAGNLSAAISDTITLDSTAPSGSVAINGGAASTYSGAVNLTLGASDALSPQGQLQMQVSNDSGFSGAVWQPFQASLSWTLLPGLGSHTVYVRYRDAAGNVSSPYHTGIKVLASFYIPIVKR
jgi:hypothetical protein